jgi:thymidine phosphorylase
VRFERALEALEGAWEIADSAPQRGPFVVDRIA